MDIKDAAMKYLAPRARTCGELERHLRMKGYGREDVRELIGQFQELHYLDDMDYAVRYFEHAFGKGRGALRAKRELEEKGVSQETIQIAFEECESGESELERAKKQARKIAEGREMDRKLMGKIGRRLTTMGYSSDVIYQALESCMRRNPE